MLLATWTIISALTLTSYVLARSMLHPAVVYSSVWLFQLTGLMFFSERFVPLSLESMTVVILGCLSFVIGTQIRICEPPAFSKFVRIIPNSSIRFYFVAVVVTFCLWGQYRAFSNLTGSFDFDVGLVYVRTLISIDGEDVYGLFKYGSPLALAGLLVLQILWIRGLAKLRHKILFWYLLAAAVAMAVLSTGRGPIVFVFLLTGLTYVLAGARAGDGVRLASLVAAMTALMFAAFWIMGRAMGKADEDAGAALANLNDYLFSSIPALSVFIAENPIAPIGVDYGGNTFRIGIAVASAIGLSPPPPSLVQDFIAVPHLTNLYTLYLQYILDFGWAGVIVLPMLLGATHGWLYRAFMRDRSREFILLLLVISYLPLLQVAFQETHFSTIATWIQLFIVGLLLTESKRTRPLFT
jgi:oligosaccharide repeat unit polymerase